jgi:hypothetical protein
MDTSSIDGERPLGVPWSASQRPNCVSGTNSPSAFVYWLLGKVGDFMENSHFSLYCRTKCAINVKG